jgi:GNAT superfamily N-acetyltransferase
VDLCYRLYGEQLCPQGADADLSDLESNYPPPNAMLYLLTDETGEARGSLGAVVDERGVCKLRRLYLEPGLRGGGWGGLLMDWTLGWARGRGASEAIAWSDVRFVDGHRFFLRRGFEARPDRRTLHDGVEPYTERLFVLRLE